MVAYDHSSRHSIFHRWHWHNWCRNHSWKSWGEFNGIVKPQSSANRTHTSNNLNNWPLRYFKRKQLNKCGELLKSGSLHLILFSIKSFRSFFPRVFPSVPRLSFLYFLIQTIDFIFFIILYLPTYCSIVKSLKIK